MKMEEMKTEMKERLEFNDMIQLQLGAILLGIPVGAAYALALQLDQSLLQAYDVHPGVPTPEDPEAAPYLTLKEEFGG